jgi:proline utilization trans-activator
MPAELPPAEYVEFLLNSVHFHLGSVFCLFDKASFLDNLRQHYESGTQQSTVGVSTYQRLWIMQARLIVAFGQLVTGRQVTEFGPPGAENFVQAVQSLPNIYVLCRELTLAIEVLCLVAFIFSVLT